MSRASLGRQIGFHNHNVSDLLQLPDGLDVLLQAARVHCLSKVELYFLQEGAEELRRPLNLRNEAAAVSLLLAALAADPATQGLLGQLVVYSRGLFPEFASGGARLSAAVPSQAAWPEPGSVAADFHAWAEEQGIRAEIGIADFGGLRGCGARHAIDPGSLVLSVPQQALIYAETVAETDLGRMLQAIPGISSDAILIVFTMVDRHDEDSRWAPFWRSLPERFFTGLSFPEHVVAALAGTAAELEIWRGQQHLQEQFAATRPLLDMLLAAYPQLLRPEFFTYDCYLWACELFYSYAFDVEFPSQSGPGAKVAPITLAALLAGEAPDTSNGDPNIAPSKTVMVPLACHVNHSPWPHVVRYGRLNPATCTLDYPAFRPCQAGKQLYISYGPVPNLKLLVYYGFVLRDNPHDLVLLHLELPSDELQEQRQQALQLHSLNMEHNLQDGPLSKQLLGYLRVVVATAAELQQVLGGSADPLQGPLNGDNERQALETLEAALQELLQPLQSAALLRGKAPEGLPSTAAPAAGAAREAAAPEAPPVPNENGLDADWRASLEFCRIYLEGQLDILQRALQECKLLQCAAA